MKLDDMSQSQINNYNNLKSQIDSTFKHCNECAFKTRDRYTDAMYSFGKFLATEYRKQNITKIKNSHIQEYVVHMQKKEYSKSYVTTNLSAIRYFYDKTTGGSFIIKSNKELGVNARDRFDRIGGDKSISDEQFDNLLFEAKKIGREDFVLEIKVGAILGLRIHEVFSLRRTQIMEALKKMR